MSEDHTKSDENISEPEIEEKSDPITEEPIITGDTENISEENKDERTKDDGHKEEITVEKKVTVETDNTTENLIKGNITINSDIECDGVITIDGATIKGNIKADSIRFAGVIHGDLTADKEIVLYRDAEIHGNLKAKNVNISGKVSIDGQIITG